jgi:hypothetical protein
MSWEERMAAKAAARRVDEPEWIDPHGAHHTHYRGNSMWCSCGAHLGVFSIIFTEDAPPAEPCQVCGWLPE